MSRTAKGDEKKNNRGRGGAKRVTEMPRWGGTEVMFFSFVLFFFLFLVFGWLAQQIAQLSGSYREGGREGVKRLLFGFHVFVWRVCFARW